MDCPRADTQLRALLPWLVISFLLSVNFSTIQVSIEAKYNYVYRCLDVIVKKASFARKLNEPAGHK